LDTLNKVNPYVIGVTLFAVTFAGVAGSAFAIYKEVTSPHGYISMWLATDLTGVFNLPLQLTFSVCRASHC